MLLIVVKSWAGLASRGAGEFPKGQEDETTKQSTAEPVFGTLINFMALKRINTRGNIQAEKVMQMGACAYKLKKWLKFSQNRRRTAALALQKLRNECFCFLPFLHGNWRKKNKNT